MEYYLKGTGICMSQKSMITNYGDAVWGGLCDTFPDGFTIAEAAFALGCIRHLAPRTRTDIVRSVLRNVEAEWGVKSATWAYDKRGGRYYKWVDLTR